MMERIGVRCREKIVDTIKADWQSAQACVVIGFDKVGAFHFNLLRNQLKKEDTSVLVSKNSLAKRAFQDLNISETESLLSGSTGLILINGQDLPKVCKVLVDFSKENAGLVLKGGFLKDKRLDEQQLQELSKLPPRSVLLAQAVMTMASPLSGFIATLNNVILKFVWLLEELKKKKEAT